MKNQIASPAFALPSHVSQKAARYSSVRHLRMHPATDFQRQILYRAFQHPIPNTNSIWQVTSTLNLLSLCLTILKQVPHSMPL